MAPPASPSTGTPCCRPRLSPRTTFLASILLLAACESSASGAGGGGAGEGGAGESASGEGASDPDAGEGGASDQGAGGRGAGGQGAGGDDRLEVCPLPEIELEARVTFADGLDTATADQDVDRSVSGSVVEVGSTIVIEGPGAGALTRVELSGTTPPDLSLGAQVELRVVFRDGFWEDSTYLEIVDTLDGTLRCALFAGPPRTVEGATVQLELEPTCTDEIDPDDYDQLVNTTYVATITVDGVSVTLDGGELAALGESGLEVEHQGTFTGIMYDSSWKDRTGIVVRPAP